MSGFFTLVNLIYLIVFYIYIQQYADIAWSEVSGLFTTYDEGKPLILKYIIKSIS